MKKFTLIELLIVIAMIGILTSMLMPSLKGAREASYQAVSKSNLSQIYKQFMIHVDDNDDQLPGIKKIDGTGWLYWRNYLEESFGGRENARRILLIPGQSYPSNSRYSYSPTETVFAKNGRFLTQNGGRKVQNIFQPSEAFLMVEGKVINGYADSSYRLGWGNLVTDRDKSSSSETTHTNFPYFEKMLNLKAIGSVNAIHFKATRNITQGQWMGLDR